MEFDTSTLMMIFFLISLVVSIGKIYVFLPNKELEDDDTTQEAQKHLTSIMINTIKENNAEITVDELYIFMLENENFNSEKFWRFNLNKLKQLLKSYYLQNPHTKSITDIYNETKV